MKKLLLIATLFFVVIACRESTNIPLILKKNEQGKDIRPETMDWKTFQKYCGPQNISCNTNFMKIKDIIVTWEGKVYAVREDDYVKNNSSFAPKIIQVKMADSSSVLSDVTLRLPPNTAAIYDALKKDDTIVFRGKLAYLGSKLNDHVILVEKFKKK